MLHCRKLYVLPLIFFANFFIAGCESIYFQTMEKFGYDKRHILVNRVEKTRVSQLEVKSQFSSALKELQSILNYQGGQLEQAYDKTKDEYELSLASANMLTERINMVESVASALFTEWSNEIKQISNARLRQQSQNKLVQTQQLYQKMLTSMHRSEKKMTPVLTSMKDNMLFLKHNLNAKTIGAIKTEFSQLNTNISLLINEMNNSINESDKFIQQLSD